MDEYPKFVQIGVLSVTVGSAKEEAEWRKSPLAPVPEVPGDEASDLDESAEPDAPVKKKAAPKGGKKK